MPPASATSAPWAATRAERPDGHGPSAGQVDPVGLAASNLALAYLEVAERLAHEPLVRR
jgi:hypothetical protein